MAGRKVALCEPADSCYAHEVSLRDSRRGARMLGGGPQGSGVLVLAVCGACVFSAANLVVSAKCAAAGHPFWRPRDATQARAAAATCCRCSRPGCSALFVSDRFARLSRSAARSSAAAASGARSRRGRYAGARSGGGAPPPAAPAVLLLSPRGMTSFELGVLSATIGVRAAVGRGRKRRARVCVRERRQRAFGARRRRRAVAACARVAA